MDIIPGLDRPFSIMDFGPPKVGKTTLAGTILTSEHVDPEKVIYLDNHGSTASLVPVPHQFSDAEPWGVLKSRDPDRILKGLKRAISEKGRYEGIVLDDLSEQALADMDARNKKGGGDKARMRNWGDHLEEYTSALRELYPEDSGMYSIVLARASWLKNPLKKPDPEKPMDRSDQLYQPLFKGQLGDWIPYSFDLVTFHSLAVVGGEILSEVHFWPEGDTVVANRWLKQWKDKRLPKKLGDPSFDKIYDLITKVYEKESN